MANKTDKLVELAKRQVGKRYVWATAGPDTFDCSGLVWWCVNELGGKLSPELRGSQTQWEKLGSPVKKSDRLRAGDILFFDTNAGRQSADHEGIYDGEGNMIHAFNESEGVVISSIGKPYWTERFIGARRVFSGGSTTPTGQRANGSPDQSSSPAPSEPPKTTARTSDLGAMTPFRSIGDVSREQWRTALAGSPISDVDACYDACIGYTALALSQAVKESSLGTTPSARDAKNPLGLLLSDGRTLQSFAYWPLAFAEYRKRLTDPSYKGAPGPYFPASVGGIVSGWDMSLLAYLITYVGGPRCLTSRGAECANGETYDERFPKDGASPNGGLVRDDARAPSINRYCAQTLHRLRTFLGLADQPPDPTGPSPDPAKWQRIRFAGSTVDAYLPVDVVFKTKLTPLGNNRHGHRMAATGTTQHETGNPRVGTGAEMHSTWQDNGTPGHPDGYIGVHFYVDDDIIIQKIPVNECSIHAGTWERNHTQISVERCVNPDQTPFAQSERNSAYLQAALLKYVVGKTGKEAMYPHYSPPGQGSCPVHIGRTWTAFEDRVDDIIRQLP